MPSPEERQAKAQEAIAQYLKGLIPVLTVINQNLVDFAKMVNPQQEHENFLSFIKTMQEDPVVQKMVDDRVYEIRKEGE
jgi:hypothetical protein